MDVKNESTKNENDKLDNAKKFIIGKISLLNKSYLEHMEELTKLNQELMDISKILEKEKSNKDVNLLLFSPYSHDTINTTEYKLQEKIGEYKNSITKLNIIIEEERGELEQFKILEEVLNEKRDGLQDSNLYHMEKSEEKSKLHKACTIQKVEKKIIDAQEIERNRIARDLHDSTVQNLTALVHKAELCTKLIDIDTIRMKFELVSMIDVLRATINEMRSIIYDLRPMSLNDLGLVPTVEALLEDIKKKHSIQATLISNKEKNTISSTLNLTLYRVIQEACNNVVKHAKATIIQINITYLEDELQLEIIDDGKGFDLNSLMNEKNCNVRNFGLSIMEERVKLFNGTFNINTKIHQGTKIRIVVPYCSNEEETTE